MTVDQEDALYEYLDEVLGLFSVADAAAAVRRKDSSGSRRLPEEIAAFLETRRLAFPKQDGWISRRGCFENGTFVIEPTRLEIRNGILIPGHRCIPFANPVLLPHELNFRFKGEAVPFTTSEGPPEDFYPYYDLFGEEYAPQYLARDNPENEASFNADPYEDPPEVSVKTLDMRAIYRELGFVPGDRFIARCTEWKSGLFDLEKSPVLAEAESGTELAAWAEAAEAGFAASFDALGPGASTEEQIAFAYWHGGERMRRSPAYPLEYFLYEKTVRIETVPYGMETRFWRAGKDIPDTGPWTVSAGPPDKTEVETLLARLGIPVSEYVVESYIRDSFFRKESEVHKILERLLPASVVATRPEQLFLAHFVAEAREDLSGTYNFFADRDMGALRTRAAELHTAVVELVARLKARDTDSSWLPKHSLVTLAQLQHHAANLLEDLDYDEPLDERELDGMENSLDAMIDTFDDLKLSIEDASDGYRRSRMTLVRADSPAAAWRTLQISLAGTKVWRRVLVPDSWTLKDLHRCVQSVFGWRGSRLHGFVVDGQVYGPDSNENTEDGITIGELADDGNTEIAYDYDYGAEWEARITLLHAIEAPEDGQPACLAGEGAPPPEGIGGPLRFRRFIAALSGEDGPERRLAAAELGEGFAADAFDPKAATRGLVAAFGSATN